VAGLEQRIADLTAANQGLESKLAAGAKNPTAAPTVNPMAVVGPAPVPTVTVTVTPASSSAQAPAAPAAVGSSPLFGALPRNTQDLTAESGKLPITVSPARVSWGAGGRALRVSFNIQYTGAERGTQQGRIVILARGPSALVSYPEGVLASAGSESLIQPQQGEYFSVSRFREVKADFPEIRGASTGQIRDVEILILSLEGQLLFYQKIAAAPAPAPAPPHAPKKASAPPAPAAKPKAPETPAKPAKAPEAAAPAASAHAPAAGGNAGDLIEPGVDQ
jgi:hypothetical protein